MASYCAQCGTALPPGARFCPSCGARVHEGGDDAGHARTTASFDPGELDPTAELEDRPDLATGTGLLVVVRGPNAGSRYLLDRDVTTIGRHPEAHVLLDDVTVSRQHTEVRRTADGFLAADMGSLNGTYVNGELTEERTLRSGDELQVGRFKLLLVTGDADAARVP